MNPPPPKTLSDFRSKILSALSALYAIFVGALLALMLTATFLQEGVPLVRVIGLGCYGFATFGVILHLAISIGLWLKASWVEPLIQGMTLAIVLPLFLAAMVFLILPIPADLNQGVMAITAVVLAVPWLLYLKFTYRPARKSD